jgi:hypothetical protein
MVVSLVALLELKSAAMLVDWKVASLAVVKVEHVVFLLVAMMGHLMVVVKEK